MMFCLLRENFFMFCGIFDIVFLIFNSGGVFRLSVSGNADFFSQFKLYVSLRTSLKIVELYKLSGLDLIFV